MNDLNMTEEIQIVNKRVLHMLDCSEVNSELFFHDVRKLSKLVNLYIAQEGKVNEEQK